MCWGVVCIVAFVFVSLFCCRFLQVPLFPLLRWSKGVRKGHLEQMLQIHEEGIARHELKCWSDVCNVAFCFCFFILLQVFAGARFSLFWLWKRSEEGTLKKCSKYIKRHCEAWALKVVNVLRCCLHCSLWFCFFVLLQVFAGAPFSFA